MTKLFTQYQRAFLTSINVNAQAVEAAEHIASTGNIVLAVSLLKSNGLSDAAVLKDIETFLTDAVKAQAKPANPFAKGAASTPNVVLIPSQQGTVFERISRLMTPVKRDGSPVLDRSNKPIVKGVHKRFIDNPSLWPTVDAFGRPFPSLETLASGTKEQVKDYLTGSGWPKCHMDAQLYYMHSEAGASGVIVNQVQQQERVTGVKVDPKTIPADIKDGDWRYWNGDRSPSGKRFYLPAQHPLVCQQKGILPVEFEALKPAATAAPVADAPKAKRERKAKA